MVNSEGGSLEEVLLVDVQTRLDRWSVRYADQRELQRKKLLLLALEREQIVAVAYREESVAGRVAALAVDDDVRALIRQTLIWIWKDEQLHAEYLRGELLRMGGIGSKTVVYGRQIQGAISGWTSATSNHRKAGTAPFRAGAAGLLIAMAGVLKQIPPVLQHELRYQTFHRYCELNVALEASAELAYRRLVELSTDDGERRAIERIRKDEACHRAAFVVLADVIADDDTLANGQSSDRLCHELAQISKWFIPAELRTGARALPARRPLGSRRVVAVSNGSHDGEKIAILEDCLDRAGLAELARKATSASIRVSFMLGYDRNDQSTINDPELVDGVARYLHRYGVDDVSVLDAPTVYGNDYGHRSVGEVANYFGFVSDAYRIVDISEDLEPFDFARGFVQHGVPTQWMNADLRIVMPKLRTDPIEYAHLSFSTLEGSNGAIDDTVYAGRQVDFRSATMMLLDVAPPDFSIVDAWAPVAQGPFGVMACSDPADIRTIYAGADALSVDEVILADLGIEDSSRAPIIRMVYHWFGLQPGPAVVDGVRPALGTELRGAHSSKALQTLGTISFPIYMYLSKGGQVFVPAFDTEAFPPLRRISPAMATVQRTAQRAFGLHAPRGRR